ncbi:hypothetical protein D3C85_1697060 [compost metagenome]
MKNWREFLTVILHARNELIRVQLCQIAGRYSFLKRNHCIAPFHARSLPHQVISRPDALMVSEVAAPASVEMNPPDSRT